MFQILSARTNDEKPHVQFLNPKRLISVPLDQVPIISQKILQKNPKIKSFRENNNPKIKSSIEKDNRKISSFQEKANRMTNSSQEKADRKSKGSRKKDNHNKNEKVTVCERRFVLKALLRYLHFYVSHFKQTHTQYLLKKCKNVEKEINICHKLKCYNPYIFAT